jgi:hypothetical protein
VTLNLTIINPWGIWQSSDLRLVDPATWKLVDDYSIKHVNFRCRDGDALLAYAGAGRVHEVDLSDWIRETLRGEIRTLNETFVALRENATRDLAPLLRPRGVLHMFSVGAFRNGQPWVAQIRNFAVEAGVPKAPALDRFETVTKVIDPPGQGFIFGDLKAVPAPDRAKLFALATRRPRHPSDYRGLLAAINKRASATPSGRKTVSPHCVTSYLPPTGWPGEMGFHELDRPPVPLIVPTLLFGIDLTEMQRGFMKQAEAWRKTLQPPTGAFDQSAEEAIRPKNRLRRPK